MDQEPKPDIAEQEWEEECKKGRAFVDELLNEFKRVYPDDEEEQAVQFTDFATGYKNPCISRAELEKYVMWHLLIGSTPRYEWSPFFDLSGEQSIIKYLQEKLEQLKKM